MENETEKKYQLQKRNTYIVFIFLKSLNFWPNKLHYLLNIRIYLMLLDQQREQIKTEKSLKSAKLSPEYFNIDYAMIL